MDRTAITKQSWIYFLADPEQNLRILLNTAHLAAMVNPSEQTLEDKTYLPSLF